MAFYFTQAGNRSYFIHLELLSDPYRDDHWLFQKLAFFSMVSRISPSVTSMLFMLVLQNMEPSIAEGAARYDFV